jgi:hypothetical protein
MCAELVCRLVGWGKADSTVDPFVGFTAVRPLFQKTADGLEYRTAADRLQYFREDQFAAVESPENFGCSSSVDPLFRGIRFRSKPVSHLSQADPETAQPDRVWEVVNWWRCLLRQLQAPANRQ